MHRYQDVTRAVAQAWEGVDRGAGLRAALSAATDAAGLQAVLAHVRGTVRVPEDQARSYDALLERAVRAQDTGAVRAVIRASDCSDAVQAAVVQQAAIDRGVRFEGAILDSLPARSAVAQGRPVGRRNDKLFRKALPALPLADNGAGASGSEHAARGVIVMGRVDGMVDANQIVEVKNRAAHFFDVLPLYERVQVQLYMWLTGAETCLFVQRLDGDMREELVPYDEAFLLHVVFPAIHRSLSRLERIMSGPGPERIDLVQRLVSNCGGKQVLELDPLGIPQNAEGV
jgi:hypothetical protein